MQKLSLLFTCFITIFSTGSPLFSQEKNDSLIIRFAAPSYFTGDELYFFMANGKYRITDQYNNFKKKYPVVNKHILVVPSDQRLFGEAKITSFQNRFFQSHVSLPRYTYKFLDTQKWHSLEDIKGNISSTLYTKVQDMHKEDKLLFNIVEENFINPETGDTVVKYFQKVDFRDNPEIIDSIVHVYDSIRSIQYQGFADSIMEPFYMSRSEVTVGEYREFINWVMDSLMTRKLYFDLDEERAYAFLNISRKTRKHLSKGERAKYMELYGLRYLDQNDKDAYIPELTSFYYLQPERFYKRREIDISKLVYKTAAGIEIPVYPDTSILFATVFPSFISNMYFWHPAYYNYPVLGVSYRQALAYCDWKMRRMNETLAGEDYRAEVTIPSLYEYEMAVKATLHPLGKNQTGNLPNDQFHVNRREAENSTGYLVSSYQEKYLKQPVDKKELNSHYGNSYKSTLEYKWEFNHWHDQNATPPFNYLNGNASEYCSTPVTPEMIDFYKLKATDTSVLPESVLLLGSNFLEDIIDLKGNQNNAIFYKRIVPKSRQGETSGFRTVVRYRRISDH